MSEQIQLLQTEDQESFPKSTTTKNWRKTYGTTLINCRKVTSSYKISKSNITLASDTIIIEICRREFVSHDFQSTYVLLRRSRARASDLECKPYSCLHLHYRIKHFYFFYFLPSSYQ